MKITDGKRTVEVLMKEWSPVEQGYLPDVTSDLLIDSSSVYDAINEVWTVPSVQDVLDYCQEWENEDPDNHYFDWEEVHDDARLRKILVGVKVFQELGVELMGEKDITVSESAYADMFESYNGKMQAGEGLWYIYTVVEDLWIGTVTNKPEQYINLNLKGD